MTDVMVLADGQAIAIEAKHTEPKYDTIGAWLKKGRDRENRAKVLNHWRHLIEAVTDTRVDQTNFGSVVYQTLHRTASACAATPQGGVAHVMYLAFVEPGSNIDYAKDLWLAATVLDPGQRMEFTLVTVSTSKGDHFNNVAELMNAAASDEDRVEILADALVSRRDLYRFGEPKRFPIR